MFSWKFISRLFRLRTRTIRRLAKGEVFLPDETDSHRDTSDEHLAGRGIPTQEFYAEFQAKIVHQQIYRHDKDIASKLSPSAERRLSEGNVLIEPKACQQGDWENNT